MSTEIQTRIAAPCKQIGMRGDEIATLAMLCEHAGVTPETAGYAVPELIECIASHNDPQEHESLRVRATYSALNEYKLLLDGRPDIKIPAYFWIQYVISLTIARATTWPE